MNFQGTVRFTTQEPARCEACGSLMNALIPQGKHSPRWREGVLVNCIGNPVVALLSVLLVLVLSSCGPARVDGPYDSTWTPAFGKALSLEMVFGESTLIVQGESCEVVQSDEEEMVSALCPDSQGSALLTLFGSPWPSHLVGSARLYDGAPNTWRYGIDAKERQ